MLLDKYKVNAPEGRSGIWSVGKFEVSKSGAKLSAMRSMFSFSSRGRYTPAGLYTGLYRNARVIMSDTPDELRDQMEAIRKASGNCLINGLGLGVTLAAFCSKPEVNHVTVIELEPDVIKLVGTHWINRFRDKLTIINDNAFEWKPPKGTRYDVIWHDVWDDVCDENLEGMKKLHRKYGRRTDWQGSWCRGLCEQQRRTSLAY